MIALNRTALFSITLMVAAQFSVAQEGQWRHFGGDPANTKYSPLDQIAREYFEDLEIAWRWESIDAKITVEHTHVQAGQF